MDQYPFDINIEVAGCDVDRFLIVLKNAGFYNQASEAGQQIKEQIKSLNQ